MGYNQSSTLEEIENKKDEDKKDIKKNNKKDNDNKKEKDDSEEKNNNNNSDDKNSIDKKEKNNNNTEKELLDNKLTKKKDGEEILNMDDKKDLSNIMTEGFTSENRKIDLHRQNYEGVVLMKGVEESITEDLNEDDIYQLVEAALYDKMVEDKEQDEGKITKKQAKAIASILYNKINKEEGKKGNNKNTSVNLKDYPELKGMKIKIGVGKLTREIIKNMMFQDKKVDECQIDLTYANLTRENSDIKALTIELEP